MSKTAIATEDQGSSFDGLLGLQTEAITGEEEATQQEPQNVVDKKEFDDLKTKYEELSKQVPNQDQLQKIIDNNKKLEALQEVFLPNKEKATVEEKKRLLDAFDADPIGFLENKINDKVAIIAERQTNSDVDRFAKEVMAEIDKEYAVDWKKDGNKIGAEMARFTVEEKRQDPKGTTIRAMRLAGVGKKRTTPLPYFESSDYSAIQEKARKTEVDARLESLRAVAKEMNQNPLKGFWEKN